jgi:uncharacterized protein (TIGR02145 family)
LATNKNRSKGLFFEKSLCLVDYNKTTPMLQKTITIKQLKIMKKILFFFAMLVSVTASAQVTNVTPISANYTNKTVSFRVWWDAGTRNATHLSKVWVWVDYITVNSNNTTSGNTWTRAAVSSASPTASVSYDGTNRQGFWLQGATSGAYSATVTVQLNITASKFNWCAYVSDYPPNVTVNNGTYTFKGTPPFTLIAANGTTTQTVSGKTLTASSLTITPVTIRDKTECPGVFCPYSGSDLFIDATRLCQQRTAGAKNWEAHIIDSRDSKIYRIILMPDNKWWLAQNLKYAGVGNAVSGCTEDQCGRSYSNHAQIYAQYAGGSYGASGNVQGICPPGWLLPITADVTKLVSRIGSEATVCQYLRRLNADCSTKTNYYGWASIIGVRNGEINTTWESWYTNDSCREDGFIIDLAKDGNNPTCGVIYDSCYSGYTGHPAQVRCFRQL